MTVILSSKIDDTAFWDAYMVRPASVGVSNKIDDVVAEWLWPLRGAVADGNGPSEEFYPYPYPCPEPPTPDVHKPVVTFVDPVPGVQVTPNQTVTFDVTDDIALRRVLVALFINTTAVTELAHDGTAFTARYAAHSTMTAVVGGFRYAMRRTGGWPSGSIITVRVFAVDTSGNIEDP